jgi:cytochrome c oxidase assembly protein subunit 15
MMRPPAQTWLHRYALLTAAATLALVGIGGVVTSRGVGMAVPDWPTTYGYNMFFFPFSKWVGGIFYEHSHRLVASVVGVLVVGLTRWLGGRRSRLPLALIGLGEVLGGLALLRIGPTWQGAGHFLSGIGGVVLLGAAVWSRNEPAARPLPLLGWLAFWGVQIQGLLGGLRVVLYRDQLGIFHATLAQLFFVLVCAIALLTSRWWQRANPKSEIRNPKEIHANGNPKQPATAGYLLLATTFLILLQLILGATMRHQHAGLAIPDFPLAYGRVWPAMDDASVTLYNQQRMEATAVNPISGGQIVLQMAHRLLAGVILGAVAVWAWRARRQMAAGDPLSKMAMVWLGVILLQVLLGATTIWSKKAADIATAHVLAGALALAVGALQCIIWVRQVKESGCPAHHEPVHPPSSILTHPSPQLP